VRRLLAAAVFLAAGGTAWAQIGQVNGTVLRADRTPVVGASVALIPKVSHVIWATSTAQDGRYAFKGLAADTYSVVVMIPGGGAVRKDGIRVRALFRSIVDFNLQSDPMDAGLPPLPPVEEAQREPTFTFSATLINPEREPSPDALVTLIPIAGDGAIARCQTKADGACELAGVPEGTYRISARAPGFMTWTLYPVVFKGTGDIEFDLALVAFPMGFRGSFEDLLVPTEPVPPAEEP